jgi:putative membrane protein
LLAVSTVVLPGTAIAPRRSTMGTLNKLGVVAAALTMLLPSACNGSAQTPPRQPASPSEPAPLRAYDSPVTRSPDVGETDPMNLNRPSGDEVTPPTLEPPPEAALEEPRKQPLDGTADAANKDQKVLAKTEKALTDAEVVNVALTANQGPIQMAELAIKRAQNTDVKQLAGIEKTQHSAAIQKVKALQGRTKLSNAPSDVSSDLENDASTAIHQLHAVEGTSFDQAYLEAEIKSHKDVITAIDNRLTRSATNGEVKAMLVETRRTMEGHLIKAEEAKSKLERASSVAPSTGTTMGVTPLAPNAKP